MIHVQMLATTADGDLGEMFSLERWTYAGKMTLLGMVMVFAVLGVLWVALTIFRRVMAGKTVKVKLEKHTEATKTKSVSFPKTEPFSVVTPVPQMSDNDALIAAITAAIAAYRAEEGMDEVEAGAFRVVSFRSVRSVSGGRGWNTRR